MLKRILFCFVCLLLGIAACSRPLPQRIKEGYRAKNLDGQKKVPQWLMFQVQKALPSKGLNVWVPTGSFNSSSLVRVPRFPDSKYARGIKQLKSGQLLSLRGVCNEQVSAQLAIAATDEITNMQVVVGDLKTQNGSVIKAKNTQVRFVAYVPVEEALVGNSYKQVAGKKGLTGISGDRKPDVVGDPLVALDRVSVPRLRAQPIWFTIKIPKHSKPGVYHGTVSIRTDQYKVLKLNLNLKVQDYTIPDPKNDMFFLHVGINPFSIADYYNIKPWSKAHWHLLDSYFDDLASIGNKAILTTITEKPWKVSWLNGKWRPQTYIGYHSMVKWRLKKDSQWKFDYSIFDEYVKTALSHGVGPSILIYSMLTFRGPQRLTYFDEQKDKKVVEKLNVDDSRYKKVWSIFLKDFSEHLKAKGWFDQTYLAFDERPAKLMKPVWKIIKQSAPDFLKNIANSGSPDVGLYGKHFKISLSFFSKESPSRRNTLSLLRKLATQKGKKIMFYTTCCSDAHPNQYTYSPAIESRMIPWIALKYHLDGYVRWDYNNWPKDVFKLPVFSYTQGDEYFVYPGKNGPMSSIRWELLKDGIEDYELVQILKKSGQLTNKKLNRAIKLAARNPDGRAKDLQDITKARHILLNRINKK